MSRVEERPVRTFQIGLPDGLAIKDDVKRGKPAEAVIRISPPGGPSEDSMGLPAGALPTLSETLAALDRARVSRRD